MFVAEWTPEQGWEGQMLPYGPLNLDPAAQARFCLDLHLLCLDLHKSSTLALLLQSDNVLLQKEFRNCICMLPNSRITSQLHCVCTHTDPTTVCCTVKQKQMRREVLQQPLCYAECVHSPLIEHPANFICRF